MPIRLTLRPAERDAKRLREAFERLSKAGKNRRRVLGRIGLFIRREAAATLRRRKRDWGPATGRLSKSLAMLVDENSVTVGSNLAYAAIQQLGGTVTPQGHKYLAIPVLGHLRRRGVWPRDLPRGSMKFKPDALIRIGSHQWTGPALVRAQGGTIGGAEGEILGQYRQNRDARGKYVKGGARSGGAAQSARGEEGQVMFALVKRVTIRGRPYLEFSAAARAFALREIEAEYRRAWKG